MKRRTAILISGNGTNMQAIIEAAKHEKYPATIDLVISNNIDAPGLQFARDNGIETFSLSHKQFGKDRTTHEWYIHDELMRYKIQVVCLAGYMRILSPAIVSLWQGKMINIHPSLLPAFTGLHTHKRALEARVKFHGCTVHEITDELDWGPIVDQAIVKVSKKDTEESLNENVLKEEHKLYPKALKKFIEGLNK